MLYDRGGFRGRYSPHSRGAIDVLVVTETRTDGVHLDGALGKVCTTYSLLEVACNMHGSRLILRCLGSRRAATQIAPSMRVQTILQAVLLVHPSHPRYLRITMHDYHLYTSLIWSKIPGILVSYFAQDSVLARSSIYLLQDFIVFGRFLHY
jgi:hypothetical protein